MTSPETIKHTNEKIPDASEMESISHDQREELRKSLEKAETEHNKNKRDKDSVEQAKHDALDHASNVDESLRVSQESSPARKRGLITKHQREVSFTRQMSEIQQDMTSSEKQFSKIIHTKAIEKTSDSIGSTLARPNALLAGSIAAFVTVTVVYLGAKHYGYPLSGFETIGSFIVGWALGLTYDYVRLLITGNKR